MRAARADSRRRCGTRRPTPAYRDASGDATLKSHAYSDSADVVEAFDKLCDRHRKGTTTNDEEDILKGAAAVATKYLKEGGACDALNRRCEAIRTEKGVGGRGLPSMCTVEICGAASDAMRKQIGSMTYKGTNTAYMPTYILAQIKTDCVLCAKNPNPPPPHAE